MKSVNILDKQSIYSSNALISTKLAYALGVHTRFHRNVLFRHFIQLTTSLFSHRSNFLINIIVFLKRRMAWPFSDLTQEICTSETRSFYVWLLQIFSLLAILAFCIWLSLHPSQPSFTVVDVSVPMSNDVQNSSFTLTYELEIQNSNEDSGVYYDDILTTFFFGQDTVADDVISSFYQGKDKTHRVRHEAKAKDIRIWGDVVHAVANSTAKFKVSLATRLRYKRWGKKSKHHEMNLEGVVPLGPDGKIAGKKKKKKIKLQHAQSKRRKAFKKHHYLEVHA